MNETPILTVNSLTQAIKSELEKQFRFLRIQGEISNFRQQSSGHLYFSLKDSLSQISSVMFRGNASSLHKLPKDGDKVIVRGEISVYPPHGKYQLIVSEMEYTGLGELLIKLEKLKKEIHQRGWFSKKCKQALPMFPQKIGIITSPTGAAIQDILNILNRRLSGFHALLNPVRVQGSQSAKEISLAIEQFNYYNLVDVIIIGRGGGSIEDLWSFNEEIVASAVFHSKIPIIAAIGHETDHTIAEYVADVRAPTPSAAAEIVSLEKIQMLESLNLIGKRLRQTLLQIISKNKIRLNAALSHPLMSSTHHILGQYFQKLDEMRSSNDRMMEHKIKQAKTKLIAKKEQIEFLNPKTQISRLKQELETSKKTLNASVARYIISFKSNLKAVKERIDSSWKHNLNLQSERFEALKRNLTAIDPKNLLKKGYSIAFSEKDRSVIVSTCQLKLKDNIRIKLSDGEVVAATKKIVKEHAKIEK